MALFVSTQPRRRFTWCIVALVFFAGNCRFLAAQEYVEQLRKTFWLQGRQMRKAFTEVVSEPRKWTVVLYHEKEAVARGVTIGAEGWVLTKASQLQDATLCELLDGRRLPFQYVGYDAKLDLALIKIDVEKLPVAEWEVKDPELGSWMISVDANDLPLGIGVLGVPRRAIPRSDVRGVLGIEMDMVEDAVIKQVFPNSGGQAAGLQAGDQVLKVNNKSIQTRRELVETIGTYRPGDVIQLDILRAEEKMQLSATLTYPFDNFLSRIALQQQMGGPLSFRRDDFTAVYQHDAVLKPEQCGGPVVNLEGKALGINIARAGRTATYVLPANLILEKIEELKSGKSPPPPSVLRMPEAVSAESEPDN